VIAKFLDSGVTAASGIAATGENRPCEMIRQAQLPPGYEIRSSVS